MLLRALPSLVVAVQQQQKENNISLKMVKN
jgi:hypothetical protein